MHRSINQLKESGELAAAKLVLEVTESDFLSHACKLYVNACKQLAARGDVRPRDLGQDDRDRMAFEAIAFGAFCVTVMSGKYFVKKAGFFRRELDNAAFDAFSDGLCRTLAESPVIVKFKRLRGVNLIQNEPVYECREGEALNISKRKGEYHLLCVRAANQSAGMNAALMEFGKNFALALDPQRFELAMAVAAPHAVVIVKVSELIATAFVGGESMGQRVA